MTSANRWLSLGAQGSYPILDEIEGAHLLRARSGMATVRLADGTCHRFDTEDEARSSSVWRDLVRAARDLALLLALVAATCPAPAFAGSFQTYSTPRGEARVARPTPTSTVTGGTARMPAPASTSSVTTDKLQNTRPTTSLDSVQRYQTIDMGGATITGTKSLPAPKGGVNGAGGKRLPSAK